MARGNQRDKAREAAQKKLAGQKKGNAKSGSELARDKEIAAQKMREKQAAGMDNYAHHNTKSIEKLTFVSPLLADAKKTAETATKK
ncbi:hypothetical protein B0H67DRAFT_649378 [Lasiosphaeris hirsuta]|uniref:Small EDRK-rich factor-like N-terminal domain-containing protein n=1 Tax=Lasiosphaeris hirsuta TaxID=260670 RepID=A0AA40DM82_9PEZI|nr:hypothetical protein B0H67DRAFT_649378 [Lasiosphaeris hirsuta]